MRTRLAIRANALLERHFPERRLFLRSDTDTRFIRLRPATQLIAFSGSAAIVAWSIIATAVLTLVRKQIMARMDVTDAEVELGTAEERLDAAIAGFTAAAI